MSPSTNHAALPDSGEQRHSPQRQLSQRLERLVQLIPSKALQELAALDDLNMLGELESHFAARLASNSAVAQALSRGQRERSRLLRTTDMLTIKQAADVLGIKLDSVRKRIDRNNLLAIKQNNYLLLPAFQFADGEAVDGLTECLTALQALHNWTVLDWFMLPHPDLDQRSPAASLGNDRDAVILAARRFGAQGGS